MTNQDIFILGLLCGMWLLYLAAKLWRRHKIGSRRERARRGEKKAASILEKQGFRIIEVQRPVAFELDVDGKSKKCSIRADYIVKKKGKTYVAEVKTGDVAPDINTIATRRQLLEYFLIYKPDGILLIDADKEHIQQITFKLSQDRKILYNIAMVLLLIITSFVIGYILAKG